MLWAIRKPSRLVSRKRFFSSSAGAKAMRVDQDIDRAEVGLDRFGQGVELLVVVDVALVGRGAGDFGQELGDVPLDPLVRDG